MSDHLLIAIEHDDGGVSRMQFGTRRTFKELDARAAGEGGFVLSEDGYWLREATDDQVAKEIARTTWPAEFGFVKRWWRVANGEELPPRRKAQRAAPTRDLAAEVDRLKGEVARLKNDK